MIVLNGTPRPDLEGGLSVRGLLDVLAVDGDARGVAVAVESEVVPRTRWATATVADGARVEVLGAVAGG